MTDEEIIGFFKAQIDKTLWPRWLVCGLLGISWDDVVDKLMKGQKRQAFPPTLSYGKEHLKNKMGDRMFSRDEVLEWCRTSEWFKDRVNSVGLDFTEADEKREPWKF